MKNESPKERIVLGGFFADIVMSHEPANEALYFWIVQKEGSLEILRLGTTTSLAEAQNIARSVLRELAGEAAASSGFSASV